MSKIDWDSTEYETGRSTTTEALPRGRYLCFIDSEEMKDTKKKDGKFLEVMFEVQRPKEFLRRKLWARLNVHNPSETAQRIGREQFNLLAESVGFSKGTLKDTSKLLQKRVVVFVGVERGNDNEPRNIVTGFAAVEDGAGGSSEREQPKREPAPARTGAAKAGSLDDDDDIPF